MLRSIRKQSSSWIVKVFIVVLAASFGLWGAQSFLLHDNSYQETILRVDNIDIKAFEYQSAARGLASAIAAQSDNQADIEQIAQSPEFHRQVFDRLVLRGLESSFVDRNNFRAAVSDVNSYIVRQPSFSADGEFNSELLQNFLRTNNMSLEDYQSSLLSDLTLDAFNLSLQASQFVAEKQLRFVADQRYSLRDFSVLPIDSEALRASIDSDDAAIESYWEENSQLYLSAPEYSLEYLTLSIDDIKADLIVSEEQLLEEYEFYKSEQLGNSSAEIAHILLSDANASQVATYIQEQLADGVAFAELAEQYSDDFATKFSGGSFGRISLSSLPTAVSAAVADLAVGEVSPPVRSEFGLHLATLQSELDAIASFEETRPELEDRILNSEALGTLLRQSDELADASFNADDLQSVADSLGLELQSTGLVAIDASALQELGAEFIAALSNLDDADINNNSDLLELQANSEYAVYRLLDYVPAQQQSLEQAYTRVESDWLDSQANVAALQLAQEVVAAILAQSQFSVDELDLTAIDNSDALSAWRQYQDQSLDSIRSASQNLENFDDLQYLGLGFDINIPVGAEFTAAFAPTLAGGLAVVVLENVDVAQVEDLDSMQLAELSAQEREMQNRSKVIARRALWRQQSQPVVNEDWFEENAPLQ